MNPRSLILALSFAAASLAGVAHAETSIGTSKVVTKGGSKKLKYSVINNTSVSAAKTIAQTLNNYGVRDLLASGYRVSVPAQLQNEVQIRPWKQGEEHILNARGAKRIADRLTTLISQAQRLYDKAEITTYELNTVKQLQAQIDGFNQNAALLAKYKVAVAMDE
jgi:hypothetical protein